MTRIILAAAALVLASAIGLHALFPRYELHPLGNDLARFDRWTGRVTVSEPGKAAWVTEPRSQERQLTPHRARNAAGEQLAAGRPADVEAAGSYRPPPERVQGRQDILEARGSSTGRFIGHIAREGRRSLLRWIEAFFWGQEAEAADDTTSE